MRPIRIDNKQKKANCVIAEKDRLIYLLVLNSAKKNQKFIYFKKAHNCEYFNNFKNGSHLGCVIGVCVLRASVCVIQVFCIGVASNFYACECDRVANQKR